MMAAKFSAHIFDSGASAALQGSENLSSAEFVLGLHRLATQLVAMLCYYGFLYSVALGQLNLLEELNSLFASV
jgi:hypothetical protein